MPTFSAILNRNSIRVNFPTPTDYDWGIGDAQTGGVVYATKAQPNGFTFTITGHEYGPPEEVSGPNGFGDRVTVTEKTIKVFADITYPEAFDDTNWTTFSISLFFAPPESPRKYGVLHNDFTVYELYQRPYFASPAFIPTPDFVKRVDTVFDGHTVTWQARTNIAKSLTFPIVSMTIDWKDGGVDTYPVSNTLDNLNYQYGGLYTGSIGGFTHTFQSDENGNALGGRPEVWVTNSVGMRTKKYPFSLQPQSIINFGYDDTTGELILDSSASYARTGNIVKRNMRYPTGQYTFNTLLPDLSLDPLGRKFRIWAPANGTLRYTLEILDTHSGITSVLNHIDTNDGYNDGKNLTVEHPPMVENYLRSNSYIEANEYGSYNSCAVSFTKKIKKTPVNPQQPWFFQNVNSPVRPAINNTSCPRMAVLGNRLYLASKNRDGKIKLRTSEDEALTWTERAMIWTPEYFHHGFCLLLGGGMASVALKRNLLNAGASEASKRYSVEVWFKKSYNIESWALAPVLVATFPDPVGTGISMEGTLAIYATLINEANNGGSNRLLVQVSTYNKFFESVTTGAEWRPVAG